MGLCLYISKRFCLIPSQLSHENRGDIILRQSEQYFLQFWCSRFGAQTQAYKYLFGTRLGKFSFIWLTSTYLEHDQVSLVLFITVDQSLFVAEVYDPFEKLVLLCAQSNNKNKQFLISIIASSNLNKCLFYYL